MQVILLNYKEKLTKNFKSESMQMLYLKKVSFQSITTDTTIQPCCYTVHFIINSKLITKHGEPDRQPLQGNRDEQYSTNIC